MKKIELAAYDFELGGKKVECAEVTNISYKQLVDMLERLSAAGAGSIAKLLARLTMVERVRLFDKAGAVVSFTADDVAALPVKVGIALSNAIDGDDRPTGKIINDGDGITAPLLFSLGTPVRVGEKEVQELEFMAKNYGQIEEVLAESTPVRQAYALILSASVPIGDGIKLLQTPESVAAQITMPDGMAIADQVVKLFLGERAN